ncbi:chorismate synthase [Pasteuria penetrans]|uniref:chorismate synthase n=1 Tax=Pasteuria penetrans TaxID=86005 RepID=UPI0011EF09B3|nr:chorismate synthase [Pasteuria penetrans]
MRYLTAGESHGPQLMVIVDGVPSHLALSTAMINAQLQRRQAGYGRSRRMQIEKDQVQFLGGVQDGFTTGAPVGMTIANRDYWRKIWNVDQGSEPIGGGSFPAPFPPQPGHEEGNGYPQSRHGIKRKVSCPRPGHADLVGGMKYNHRNLRHVLERSSARETAVRVAAGAIARVLLAYCGIESVGHVVQIGTVVAPVCKLDSSEIFSRSEASPVRCVDDVTSDRMMEAIDTARCSRDTLGGVLEIRVDGIPVGLGSCMQWDRKLEGRLAQAVLSVQAIKGVEFGLGFALGGLSGSVVHDEILWSAGQGFHRVGNHAGGLEGGMTTGEPLVLRAVMKPLPTLYQPLRSVNVETKKSTRATLERSDICAVPAACVVVEHVVLWEVACALLNKFPADTMYELRDQVERYRSRTRVW